MTTNLYKINQNSACICFGGNFKSGYEDTTATDRQTKLSMSYLWLRLASSYEWKGVKSKVPFMYLSSPSLRFSFKKLTCELHEHHNVCQYACISVRPFLIPFRAIFVERHF